MKQKRTERVERRRPPVELNIAGESKALPGSPKGLIAWIRRLLAGQR